jgi:hypothetical protein
VRRHIGGGCAVAALRLVTLPFAIIGLALVFYAGARVYVYYRGTPVTAIVDRGPTRGFGRGASRVWFHYQLQGERHNGSMRVSADEIGVGRMFAGRAAVPLGFGVFLRDDHSLARETLPLVLVALLFNIMVARTLSRVWIEPIRHRWIVKRGAATGGKVTGRRRLRGRGGRGVVTYSFTTGDGHTVSSRCEVSSAAYAHVAIGAPVTVLFNPAHPRHSVPYELCGFVVERR